MSLQTDNERLNLIRLQTDPIIERIARGQSEDVKTDAERLKQIVLLHAKPQPKGRE